MQQVLYVLANLMQLDEFEPSHIKYISFLNFLNKRKENPRNICLHSFLSFFSKFTYAFWSIWSYPMSYCLLKVSFICVQTCLEISRYVRDRIIIHVMVDISSQPIYSTWSHWFENKKITKSVLYLLIFETQRGRTLD